MCMRVCISADAGSPGLGEHHHRILGDELLDMLLAGLRTCN